MKGLFLKLQQYPVYGSHCGSNKLGIMELVALLPHINPPSILEAYDCFNGTG